MIPDYQKFMRPVLEFAKDGEVHIRDAAEHMRNALGLSEEEMQEIAGKGTKTKVYDRTHWARTFLKQAGLVNNPRRGFYELTERGRNALRDPETTIDNKFLEQFAEYQEFCERTNSRKLQSQNQLQISATTTQTTEQTPDEDLSNAHARLMASLAADLLDQVRAADPYFFEEIIVELFVAMGYGGSVRDAGQALGKSGDDGVDGVINQDPLGVDQIYLQAKRYALGNNIGSGAIRDFFGALSLKRATKGIFVTTSKFSPAAVETAQNLGNRIVLIDGVQLAELMIQYNIGCREADVLRIKKLDEGYFLDD